MMSSDRLAQASRWRDKPLAEKAMLALGLLILALVLPPWPGALLVLAAALGCAVAAGTPVGGWLALAAGPLAFILTGSATLMIDVTEGGLRLGDGLHAASVALRALAAVAALLLLAVTTPAAELVHGLRRLGLPAEFAEVALATYRFLFVLTDTAAAMAAAQAARLGHVGWRRRIRSTGLLAAALLPRALDRAHRLETGLAARGFDGTLRTLARRRPARAAGLARAGLLLALVGGLGAWL